ncbi:hypothetical protein F2P81_016744 [Scophthalmus maximus]|uniref:Suppressor of cytokine signaling 5-like n=1 Tax=Scophthalmus maximus TaxID=52904 RepID=A0A6A4S6G8_SCOMX|nr:hypothetical protein F2P81_016744 [Scophthalmus maximus]
MSLPNESGNRGKDRERGARPKVRQSRSEERRDTGRKVGKGKKKGLACHEPAAERPVSDGFEYGQLLSDAETREQSSSSPRKESRRWQGLEVTTSLLGQEHATASPGLGTVSSVNLLPPPSEGDSRGSSSSRTLRQKIKDATGQYFSIKTLYEVLASASASASASVHTSDTVSDPPVDPEVTGTSVPSKVVVHQTEHDKSQDGYRIHTQIGYIHCLVPDLLKITNLSCYWGVMDRYEAETLLEGKPEGTFLLRDSAQEDYLFSVSFRRYGRSLHARIEQWNHNFSFDVHDPSVFHASTVTGLLEHYKDPNSCMFFKPLLSNPIHRTQPFSLQHICRAVISSCTTYDGINLLPIPNVLKKHLKEYHYKQRVRVR